MQSWCAFFFVHRSTEADARRLVRTGAAQTAAPARPMPRSTSRREIRFASTFHPPSHRPAAVRPSLRDLRRSIARSNGLQHRVLHTPMLVSHPVHPFAVMQMLPRPRALQSASEAHVPASEQKTSSAQKGLRSPYRLKQYEPSPTSLLQVPHGVNPLVQSLNPRHSLLDRRLVQRSMEADARRLVRAGPAHAAAPAIPSVRSNVRRVIRLSSTGYLLRQTWRHQHVPRCDQRSMPWTGAAHPPVAESPP